MKNFLISLTYFILSLTSFQALADQFRFQADLEYHCENRLEGCVQKKEELDFRSRAKKDLDKIFSCQDTGTCSVEDHGVQSSILGAAISPKDLGAIFETYNEFNKDTHKSYWIPLDIDNKDLLTLALSTSLGVVFFNNEQQIMDYVQDRRTDKTQSVADFANLFGKEVIAPTALGSYFIGMVFDNGKLKEFGLVTAVTGLATQIITEGFKVHFGRSRPIHGHGPYNFNSGEKSFISGHSAGAWSFATAIDHYFGDKLKWVPYVSYSMAFLTSLARVHDHKHWASDVLAGAVVGHLVTKYLIRIFEKTGKGGLMVTPVFEPETESYYINFTYHPHKKNNGPLKCTKYPKGSRERIDACILEAYHNSQK